MHTVPPNRFVPGWIKVAPDSLLAASQSRGQPAWMEFIHVLWTMWVFVVPVFTPQGYNALWWALTALSYPLFLALYVGTLVLPARWVAPCAAGMLVLCLALLRWYPSGMSYFVFGCVMLGAHRWRSGWHYAAVLLLANVCLVVLARSIGYPWSALVWLPVTTLVVGLIVHVERQRHHKDAALRLSQDEVRRLAATAERERIGRDLHDLLGHTLSLVALKADLAGRLLQRDPEAAQREIGELGQVARDALGQVRRAVTGIRAAGLAAELAAAKVLLQGEGIDLQVDVPEVAMPPEQETVLALCLREAVTNVHRHARASRVRVSLTGDARQWRLCVEDDGRGGVVRPGNGLDGMRERLQVLGGALRIEPAPGRGTRLLADLPHWQAGATTPPAHATRTDAPLS
ncbi:sensor histidine kinase [Pseudoxanthomonas daejeonensis]|uniref:sensor histidine kinase n=1 Tax=Pseudoxanthomonas daejeonensis TaxID=266062 RepID=UPI001F542C10|nr:sensor histidine kinase [Pseudoxanthomonas daejeonensis]UNK56261.1 sensor histidine kinase [Pseudoxanthomonas daejeonensis]